MSKHVTIDGLADAIRSEVEMYSTDVQAEVEAATERAAKKLVKLTKAKAPVGYRGKFRRAITCDRTKKSATRTSWTWYAKGKEGRLTHLLVHGHATKDGGRTKGDPFLENALAVVLPEYERDIEEAVKGDK